MFTWKPIYKELAKTLLTFRNRQPELIEVLADLKRNGTKTIFLDDYLANGTQAPLAEIDPFTFFASFNRNIRPEHRLAHLKAMTTFFGLLSSPASDFDGIPLVDNQRSWFFAFKKDRKPDDIEKLWDLAKSVIEKPPEELDPLLFDRCLQIHSVGLAKLTMGMFWLNPDNYLALDGNNTLTFKNAGIDSKVTDYPSYLKLLGTVRLKLGTDYPAISSGAWKTGQDAVKGLRLEPPQEEVDRLEESTNAHYWKIAPGDKAWQWDECCKNNFIAIGWDTFGDLSGVSRAEYEKRLAKLLPKHSDWTEIGCEQLWKFSQIKKGDRIVANKGTTEVLGIGTVTGPYFFVPGVDFGHRLPVTWDDVRPRQVEKGGWKRTLISLSEEDFNAILNALPAADPVEATPFESSASNTILYGPPGTGKTYKTIERAVQIIDPDFKGNDHAAYKARFDVLRAKGQIEFITFHQSYSYEDFVEGLRPVIEGPESSEAAYEYSSGVFKRFAFRALFDCLKPAAGIVSFDAVWKKLVDQTELEPDKLYPGLSAKASYRISLTTKGNIEGVNTISNKTFLCSRSILEKVFVAKPENDEVTSSEVMEVVSRGCHSHFVAAMFNELKRILKNDFVGKGSSPDTALSSEQKENVAQAFLENSNTGADAFKPANQWPHYVLVIDEINRGNISKILGELITLIEPDKRLGAENSLVVTLPYTKQSFAVPGNLHVLGTMNTADKSIALVDVALRRRFQFEELRANFHYCPELTQPMREVLETLNRRICLRKDRDHQIGHSYFIKVYDAAGFNRVFARHVVPLLQEYFYNDWDGLRFVLGVKNQPDKLIIPLKDDDSGDSRSSWQWSFEAGNNSVNDVDFLHLLGGNGPDA